MVPAAGEGNLLDRFALPRCALPVADPGGEVPPDDIGGRRVRFYGQTRPGRSGGAGRAREILPV